MCSSDPAAARVRWSRFPAILLFASLPASAEIVHVDPPDISLNDHPFFDLDSNGTIDLELHDHGGEIEVDGWAVSERGLATRMLGGELIGVDSEFSDSPLLVVRDDGRHWPWDSIGMMGVRFVGSDGEMRFAWVRIRTGSGGSEVLDWAYQMAPETGIRAGDTTTTQCPPVVTDQPTPLCVDIGDTAEFSASACGEDLTYQWFHDDVPLADDGRISGSTTPTLTILSTSTLDAGRYSVLIDSSCGMAESEEAELTLNSVCQPFPGSLLWACDHGEPVASANLNTSETDYAMSVWFRTTRRDCGIFMVNTGNSAHDRHVYLEGGDLHARVWQPGGAGETIHTSGVNYADGNWHQVVHSFGGALGGQRLFVDGAEQAAGSLSSSGFDWDTTVTLGRSLDSRIRLGGYLDEMCIWQTALSASDVRAYFSDPDDPPHPDRLQARWRFDEGQGDTAVDLVAGLEATLSGGMVFTSPPVCCPADLNGDGEIDTRDFVLFLNDWAGGDDRADWNGDEIVNTIDFIAYLNDWGAGC